MSFSRKIRTKYDEGFGPDKFNLGSFALPRVEAKKKSGSSLKTYMLNQMLLRLKPLFPLSKELLQQTKTKKLNVFFTRAG